MRVVIFGLGFTGSTLARRLAARDIPVVGTRRSPNVNEIRWREVAWAGEPYNTDVEAALVEATHVLLSIPPDATGDRALAAFGAVMGRCPNLAWVGYLSTIGVYGDAGGGTVDEQTPVNPQSERGRRRVAAENQVWNWAKAHNKRATVFRLPGIYGPGRSQIEAVRDGTARRIVKPGQVFNRIHVDDIARALEAAMATAPTANLYNLTDGNPAPPEDVIAYAAAIQALPVPPAMPFDPASLSAMTVAFYSECKRVDTSLIWRDLWLEPLYPTYREGLRAIAAFNRGG